MFQAMLPFLKVAGQAIMAALANKGADKLVGGGGGEGFGGLGSGGGEMTPSNPPPAAIAPAQQAVGNALVADQLREMLERRRRMPVAPMTRGEALTQGGTSVGQLLS